MTKNTEPSALSLFIDDAPWWEFSYDVPIAWLWLFHHVQPTESRKLYTTVFDAAETFQECVHCLPKGTVDFEVMGLITSVNPGDFSKALSIRPDSILSLDLSLFEQSRAYLWETAHQEWERYFNAARMNDEKSMRRHWDKASFSPLRLYSNRQQGAHALAARANELGLTEKDRAEALIRFLFGVPLKAPAKALHFQWCQEAESLSWVGPRFKTNWLAKVFRR